MLQVARRLQPFLHLEPLSLEIVAGGIPADCPVRILDLASEKKPAQAFSRVLAEWRPEVVGFTAYSNQAAVVKKLARQAKDRLPQALVLAGGVHATIAPHDFQLPGVIDLVVRGEGGSAIRELLRRWPAEPRLPATEALLPTDSPRFAELAELPPPALPEYDEVPAPRRDLVDRSAYYCIWHGGPGERLPNLFPTTASVRTSVGCPNRCNFCVVHHLARGKYLQRNPQAVVDEIAALPENHVYFVDDEMFINPRRTGEIARLLIERGVRKHYISWARADTICRHPELFRLWKEAGLSLLYVGLESMEAENLRAYNKGIDVDVNYRAVEQLRELGIGLHAALMVNPDFSMEDFMKLRRTVSRIGPAEVSFTVFSPAPGTELWQQHRESFVCPDPHAFYDCMHTLLPTTLPLKKFYAQFALLFLLGVRENPWRRNRVKVGWRDLARFFWRGARYGRALRNIYRDYPDSASSP